jgi:glycosyltransferase involved in cell wall biosynthesis
MNTPVSIVTTSYNREHFLKQTIDSVLAQTYPHFELLIWDDGSSDRSVEVARKYAEGDRRIRVVAAQNQGSGGALKAATEQTTGTYLGWVDCDDWLAPTALEETVQMLDQHPTVGFVYTDYLVTDESGQVINYGERSRIPYSRDLILHYFMTFHFRLIRRSVFDQVGGINLPIPYAQDYDLCLRLSEVTQIAHLKKPLYYYRKHPGSISIQKRQEQNHSGREAVVQALQRRRLM